MGVKWIKTDKHVFNAIYTEHRKEFTVFGTCTEPEGNPLLGIMNPYILTEWGFRDACEPLIKEVGRKENRHQKEYDYEYFIAKVIREEE